MGGCPGIRGRAQPARKDRRLSLADRIRLEYACRAGGPGQQSWADIRNSAVEGGTVFGRYGGERLTPEMPGPTTRQVGTKPANAWGLHDMLGGVWEWSRTPTTASYSPTQLRRTTGRFAY